MTDQRKRSGSEQAGQDPHPETKRHSDARVPDDKSSKVPPGQRGDARTGHDKDGNEQNAARPKRAAS